MWVRGCGVGGGLEDDDVFGEVLAGVVDVAVFLVGQGEGVADGVVLEGLAAFVAEDGVGRHELGGAVVGEADGVVCWFLVELDEDGDALAWVDGYDVGFFGFCC